MTDTLFTSQTPGGTFNNIGGETLSTAFYSIVPGNITGFQIYGPSTPPIINPTCALWLPTSATTGTQLGSKQFPSFLNSGVWNQLLLDTPVTITANTLYRATEYTDFYVATGSFWTSPLSSGNLRGIQDNTDPTSAGWSVRNGTFANSTTLGTYPPDQSGNTFNAGCYFIDVLFEPATVAQPPRQALVVSYAVQRSTSW